MAGRRSDVNAPFGFLESLEARVLLSGTHYLVDSLADIVAADGALTLRECVEAADTNQAVNEAPAGSSTAVDVIRFAPDLFAAGGQSLVLNGRLVVWGDGDSDLGGIDIQGPGADLLAVDANQVANVFVLHCGDGYTFSLSDVTLTGGRETLLGAGGQGGAMWCGTESIVTMQRVTVTDNHVPDGVAGGVFNGGRLTMIECVIRGNSAEAAGGLYNWGSGAAAELIDCVVAENTSSHIAGGIANEFAHLSMTDTVIADNASSGNHGGGLWISDGIVEIDRCTFSGNAADWGGGAIRLQSGASAFISNTLLAKNVAYDGGAISQDNADVVIEASRFHENHGAMGGAIFQRWGVLSIANTCFVGNTAGDGGAVYVQEGRAGLVNCTITANVATEDGGQGGGVTWEQNEEGGAPYLLIMNSIVAGNEAAVAGTEDIGRAYDDKGAPNLISIDPLFAHNPSDGGDGWADDPGTPGVDESANNDLGDLRLSPLSPAIDAGQRLRLGWPAPLSQDYYLSDIRGAGVHGATRDLGAYEHRPMTCDFNGDEVVGLADFVIFKQDFGLQITLPPERVLADINGDRKVDLADFVLLKNAMGQRLPAPGEGAPVEVSHEAVAAPADASASTPAMEDRFVRPAGIVDGLRGERNRPSFAWRFDALAGAVPL